MTVRKAGATEFLNSSSGGGSGVFTVVASSGGDYETVSEALAAGASDIYIQTDTTETADGTFSDDTRISLAPRITWDLTDSTFSAGASIEVEVIGAPGALLTYSRATTNSPFTGVSTTFFKFRHLNFINNSSASFTSISPFSADNLYEDIEFTTNSDSAGIRSGTSAFVSVNNVRVNCVEDTSQMVSLSGRGNVRDVSFSGSTSDVLILSIVDLFGSASDIRLSGLSGASSRSATVRAYQVSNIYTDNTELSIQSSLISNVTCSRGTFTLTVFPYTPRPSHNITNLRATDYSSSGNTPGTNFVNCQFDSLTTQRDNETYSGCFFGEITVADNNINISNCQVGGLSIDGTNTITLNSGVVDPMIIGNRTENAIVDNGAVNPQLIGNVII